MHPFVKGIIYLFSIIWYTCFYIIIIPYLVLYVGDSLDWLFFTFLLKLNLSSPVLSQVVIGLQTLGLLVIPLGIAIVIISWYHITAGHNFFPLDTLGKHHLAPQKLITTGLYKHMRHPMLFGYLITLTGLAIYQLSLFSILWVIPLVAYISTKFLEETEERELKRWFGHEYQDYQEKTPALIPHLF